MCLDLKIIRDNKKLVFSWYQKPTNTNRILIFHSNHLKQHKKAIIFNLVDRAVQLSDLEDNLEDNLLNKKTDVNSLKSHL